MGKNYLYLHSFNGNICQSGEFNAEFCFIFLFERQIYVKAKNAYKRDQPWIYHCHLQLLQAANCCHNSRLVVDEDDLKWVANEKNISYIYYLYLHSFNGNICQSGEFNADFCFIFLFERQIYVKAENAYQRDQPWIYHCHLQLLQAANCCHNSRLVVNEDDLKWVAKEKNISLLIKTDPWKFCVFNHPGVGNKVILQRCKMMLWGIEGFKELRVKGS